MLSTTVVAAIALLAGVLGARAFSDARPVRNAALALSGWSLLVFATGAFSTATWIVLAAAVVSTPLAVRRSRRRRRGNELAPTLRLLAALPEGAARSLCDAAAADAEVAVAQLGRLSFASPEERLGVAGSLRSLVELGGKLNQIDASLLEATADDLAPLLRGHCYSLEDVRARQASLEAGLVGREGADGEWFGRVADKRREVLDALVEGRTQLRQIRDKAVWMVARQAETGIDDELELIDPSRALVEVREAGALVRQLAEGVGEVHLGPVTRL